jgi:hypothetical protein
MRKQHAPGIAKPLVEADFAFGGFCLEIRSNVANRECHANLLSVKAGLTVGLWPEYRPVARNL